MQLNIWDEIKSINFGWMNQIGLNNGGLRDIFFDFTCFFLQTTNIQCVLKIAINIAKKNSNKHMMNKKSAIIE